MLREAAATALQLHEQDAGVAAAASTTATNGADEAVADEQTCVSRCWRCRSFSQFVNSKPRGDALDNVTRCLNQKSNAKSDNKNKKKNKNQKLNKSLKKIKPKKDNKNCTCLTVKQS